MVLKLQYWYSVYKYLQCLYSIEDIFKIWRVKFNKMNNQNETEPTVKSTEKPTKEGSLQNYFQYAMDVLKNPDTHLSTNVNGKQQFGIITIIFFLVLVILNSLTGILGYMDTLRYFGFNDYFNYFERGLSFALAIAAVILVFKKVAEKNGNEYELDFYYEKFGAMLVLPSAVLLLSIPLNILDITIHSWISSLAFTFLYLGVFLFSFLFVEKNNYKTAVFFVAGFYLVYRLIYYIL